MLSALGVIVTVPAGSVLGTVVELVVAVASVASAVAVSVLEVRLLTISEDPVYSLLATVASAVAVVDELPEVFPVVRRILSGLLPDTFPDTAFEVAVAIQLFR